VRRGPPCASTIKTTSRIRDMLSDRLWQYASAHAVLERSLSSASSLLHIAVFDIFVEEAMWMSASSAFFFFSFLCAHKRWRVGRNRNPTGSGNWSCGPEYVWI
jgi:hypothetical protein